MHRAWNRSPTGWTSAWCGWRRPTWAITLDLVDLGVCKQLYRVDSLEQPPEVIGNALLAASVVRRMDKGRKHNIKATD
jgi:hypothetical protein